MCGVKLCAPFHPHKFNDFSQNVCNCCRNKPFGQAYNMYSLGDVSSNNGSLTCANSQSDANWTPLLPVAANAFSLENKKEKLFNDYSTIRIN